MVFLVFDVNNIILIFVFSLTEEYYNNVSLNKLRLWLIKYYVVVVAVTVECGRIVRIVLFNNDNQYTNWLIFVIHSDVLAFQFHKF